MGSSDSRLRIMRTDQAGSPWVGFCTVVTVDEIYDEVRMPNGDKYKFQYIKDGLQILEGEHKGVYSFERLDLDDVS